MSLPEGGGRSTPNRCNQFECIVLFHPAFYSTACTESVVAIIGLALVQQFPGQLVVIRVYDIEEIMKSREGEAEALQDLVNRQVHCDYV